ncbi:MAG: toll/interleukin-1 receptor domain-containing protein [Lachnospiraceae bacterium]|nr:toll/interleukin-1 receptor domain-containing protein [Lachnospiraceae bacterium]
MEAQSKQIFISFSSKESKEATRVCELLERNGFSCFISLRDLIAGEEYAAQLVDNIAGCKAVVLLLSKASNRSPHVLREVEYAVSNCIPILVYTLEECELSKSMKYYLTTHQWIPNVSDRDQRLLEGVHHIMENAPSDNSVPEKPAVAASGKIPKFLPAVAVVLLICCLMFILVRMIPVAPEDGGSSHTISENETEGTGNNVTYGADTNMDNPENRYALGDTLTFGTYHEEPIEWRVMRINDDNTLMLISKDILSMKTFDAAECGTYNSYEGVDYWSYEKHIIEDDSLAVLVRGNNDWSVSNIRTWLNSDAEAVNYEDQAPTRNAVGLNYYSNEPGFLYSFTQEELGALVPVTHTTPANSLCPDAENGLVETTDFVFLLSSDELDLLKEAGMSIYAEPSEACKENDYDPANYESFVTNYHVENYYWWLRDNPGEEINHAYVVVTPFEDGYEIVSCSVGVCSYGIRPVICVDASRMPSTE